MKQQVDSPKHYNFSKLEVIDVVEAWNLNFNEGNVLKYLARHKYKSNPLEDLKKARWYLNRIISNLEEDQA